MSPGKTDLTIVQVILYILLHPVAQDHVPDSIYTEKRVKGCEQGGEVGPWGPHSIPPNTVGIP